MISLDSKIQDELDQYIIENEKLAFLIHIREVTGCEMAEAIQKLGKRYRELKNQYPEKFLLSEDQYWDGFYS